MVVQKGSYLCNRALVFTFYILLEFHGDSQSFRCMFFPPYGRTSRVWDSLHVMKSGCAEIVGSRPGRGNSKESFSSNQETGKGFSPEMPFYSKF